MPIFEIVAHRGITTEEPENTIPAFLRAVEMGADAAELDVRLTSDQVPVVYHYYDLNMNTTAQGAIFDYSYQQLQGLRVLGNREANADGANIPTLNEVLEAVGGRIGLEIEIKGPEPEAPIVVGKVLHQFENLWESIEVTSYEPALLLSIQEQCPGLATDLLFPRSEAWMKPVVVAYQALHSARLARARAVHLHPTQLSSEILSTIRKGGIDVHAWDVNDEAAFERIFELGMHKICTDVFQEAFDFRRRKLHELIGYQPPG